MNTTPPRLYVGTYAKYNRGSIEGKWLDLEDYADKEDFYEACAELHKDEADPEIMFQDFEGFPREFYCESSVPDALFDWLALSEDDRELLARYADATGFPGNGRQRGRLRAGHSRRSRRCPQGLPDLDRHRLAGVLGLPALRLQHQPRRRWHRLVFPQHLTRQTQCQDNTNTTYGTASFASRMGRA